MKTLESTINDSGPDPNRRRRLRDRTKTRVIVPDRFPLGPDIWYPTYVYSLNSDYVSRAKNTRCFDGESIAECKKKIYNRKTLVHSVSKYIGTETPWHFSTPQTANATAARYTDGRRGSRALLTYTSSRADRAGRGVLARLRAGAPECQTGERAGQRQRVRAAGQLRRGQTSGPRRPRVHAVWHARLHGPRGGHVQGPRAGGRPLEPGRRAVRDGGRQTAVRRGRRRRSVRECRARPVPGARVLQPAAPQPGPRPGTGERGEGGGKIRSRDRCPYVVFPTGGGS